MAKTKPTKRKKVAPRRTQRKPPAKPRTKKKVLLVRVKSKRKKKKTAPPKPPTIKRNTFRAICEEIAAERITDVKQAMVDGVKSGPLYAHNYLKLFRDSVDGPPAVTQNVNANFKDDELASAARDLERKFTSLLKHVSPSDPTTSDQEVSEETSEK